MRDFLERGGDFRGVLACRCLVVAAERVYPDVGHGFHADRPELADHRNQLEEWRGDLADDLEDARGACHPGDPDSSGAKDLHERAERVARARLVAEDADELDVAVSLVRRQPLAESL